MNLLAMIFWSTFIGLIVLNSVSANTIYFIMNPGNNSGGGGCVSNCSGPAGRDGTNGTSVAFSSITNLNNGSYQWNFTDGTNYTTGNITGAAGAQGPQGPAGSTGSNGAPGVNGQNGTGISNIYVLGNNSLQINLTNGTNITTGNLSGSPGPQGQQGIQGNTGSNGVAGLNGSNWTVNTSFPVNPNIGDLFLNNSIYLFYQWNGSTWNNKGNLSGAAGPQGPQGNQGNPGTNGQNGQNGTNATANWTLSANGNTSVLGQAWILNLTSGVGISYGFICGGTQCNLTITNTLTPDNTSWNVSAYWTNASASFLPITATSGWLNSTTTVWLANNNTNVSIDNGTLYVDNTNNRVGVNNATPLNSLSVTGSAFISGNVFLDGDKADAQYQLYQHVNPTDPLNIPPNITWATTTGFVLPTNASGSGYMYAYNTTTGTNPARMFGYYPNKYNFTMGVLCATGIQNSRCGVHMDNGSNTSYVEMWLDAQPSPNQGLVRLNYRYQDNNTQSVVNGTLWNAQYFVSEFMWLKMAQTGGVIYLYAGKNNIFQPVLLAHTTPWNTSREGYYAEQPTGGANDPQEAANFDAAVYS